MSAPLTLVTGGSRGIGAAIARQANSAGHQVVITHTGTRPLDDELSFAHEMVGDVADEATIVRWFNEIDTRFGRLDVLVNNAGIAGGYGTIDCVDEVMLARLWAVNVTGPFICAREAARRMRTDLGGHGGSIVNISSKAAVLGGPGEWIHYAASKGAIDSLTVGLAKELATVGVRVNGVRPGLIVSDFHDHAPPGRLERMAPMIPMARSGSADEVATAVLWLASGLASYVTGAFIDVTGGR